MKKKITMALILTLALTALTGCGSNGNTISVVSREDGSGTRGAFVELFGIEEKDADGNKTDHTTEEANIVSKTDVMINTIAGDSTSIGYISLGSLNDSVKPLKIDGVEPSIENIKSKTYKIARPFNIATSEKVSDVTKDFMDYILSAQGQKVVEANGFIQISDDAKEFTSTKASGKIVVAGSSSVTPVMEKLKEAYAKINPNAKIEVQQSDSSTGMQAAMEGTCDIGMASRDLKDSELEKLKSVSIALDGIVVIVNKENEVSELKSDQVKQIFTGNITDWSLEK
ncbi:phosphate ABC transporter, periplasmic phosphate-binding protein PstS [Lachnospiraceae bacterium KM106-2]|nr:phosphate ABC transporter, periplasmic phosphate-binding protein PstS [Lachnospiraceae bacterium KM106-2]